MKKLLDEATDELTRSLLDAGRAHRPPAGNQTRLLLALGVGSSVGLLSSKAFAWLGSTAGKLTLVSVGVLGIAGAAYTFAPRPSAQGSNSRALSDTVEARAALTPQQPSTPGVALAQRGAPEAAVPQSALSPSALSPSAVPQPVASPQPVAVLELVPVPEDAADALPSEGSSRSRAARGSRRARATVAERPERRRSSAKRGSAVRRDDAVARAAASESASESTEAARASASSASTLKSEVALVDAMRGAAARRDGETLRRLIANYRGSFPDGQLRQEVSELALHPLATAR